MSRANPCRSALHIFYREAAADLRTGRNWAGKPHSVKPVVDKVHHINGNNAGGLGKAGQQGQRLKSESDWPTKWAVLKRPGRIDMVAIGVLGDTAEVVDVLLRHKHPFRQSGFSWPIADQVGEKEFRYWYCHLVPRERKTWKKLPLQPKRRNIKKLPSSRIH